MRYALLTLVWALALAAAASCAIAAIAGTDAGVRDPDRFPSSALPAATAALRAAGPFVLVAVVGLAALGNWYGVLPGAALGSPDSARDSEAPANDEGGRAATWLGVMATALFLAFLSCLAGLHLLCPESDPRSLPLSAYARGPYGGLMTAAFWLVGAGTAVLGLGLLRSMTRSWWSTLAGAGLLLAGAGYCLAGVYPEDIRAPDGGLRWTAAGVLHSCFSLGSALVASGVFLALPWGARRCPRWRSFFWPSVAAAAASVTLFLVRPLFPTGYAGLGQRLWVGGSLACALLVSLHLGRHGRGRTSRCSRPGPHDGYSRYEV